MRRDITAKPCRIIGGSLWRYSTAAMVTALLVANPAQAGDVDGDGVDDLTDNCALIANANQRDTDGDGYGNICDPDLNNDLVVNFIDLGLLKALFFGADADADLNGDGLVNFGDLQLMRNQFFKPPGPSGFFGTSVQIQLTQVYAGVALNNPMKMVQAPGNGSRWFVLERAGNIRAFAALDSVSASTLVLNFSVLVDTSGEGGALGMALHPDFANNGYLYVSYTEDGGSQQRPLISKIARYTLAPNAAGVPVAIANSRVEILAIDQPRLNHNGGNLEFGPDGFLYWGVGDGGGSGDPGDNAQDSTNLLGAMLRIDVDVSQVDFDAGVRYYIPTGNAFPMSTSCSTGCPEIFAWGLRNPWRWSFDSLTGDLWVADVGQNLWEEIALVEAGENHGWRCYEGDVDFNLTGCGPVGDYTFPVHVYAHGEDRSVTGGYVYRGRLVPELTGVYLYGDYISGRIWAINFGTDIGEKLDSSLNIVSFAQDVLGEVYVLHLANPGQIYRVERAVP